MKQQVNIIAMVDVIGALSDRSLHNGNLSLIDNGDYQSRAQGTPDLVTLVRPGQVVQWTVLAIDLQTPVEIKNITFLGPDGESTRVDATRGTTHHPGAAGHPASRPRSHDEAPDVEEETDGDKLDLEVWSGIVPQLPSGVAHKYRLELQMYEGEFSTLHIDSPSLMCV
ncbi:hypothetical protein ACFYVL_20825 [Streptomyces sp. NPDC004111]|uniref:hypothetical protein n=1 Tax=Streptomyces sp. NPDC004111 TaxID=3364690 RepID=UPI0036756936